MTGISLAFGTVSPGRGIRHSSFQASVFSGPPPIIPSPHPPSSPSPRSGLARAELIILLGLVVTLLAIIVPGTLALRDGRRRRQAEGDFRLIIGAAERYFGEYLTWPSVGMGGREDTRYGADRPNREVVDVLRGRPGPGPEPYRLNPNRIVCLEAPPARPGVAGVDDSGEYRDPWGTPYQIVFDTDLDGHCRVPDSLYGMQLSRMVLVWSCGPDRKSDTADDLLSWSRGKD
jgi:type II secretory pathway pseudopilin PulG